MFREVKLARLFLTKSQLFSILFVGIFFFILEGCGITNKTIDSSTTATSSEIDSVKADEEKPAEPILTPPPPFTRKDIPETPREFRGVWVATVANIDWPSKPGLPVAQQKAELIAIMERAASLNLNAVILQIRPAADALYPSPYEPWSEFLTGKQGEAPDPYYDPLEFAIKQAHQRGLELHAWFNPFRAFHPTAETDFAPEHIINQHPKWVVKYDDFYWLNPGIKKVRQYSIKVIMDVVQRYDIDGVHLDDYFYPYPLFDEDRQQVPFPDGASYANYIQSHKQIKRGDWRRQNVNKFVKKLGKAIERADSTLLFGISPFGIWRPGYPPQITGLDAYARIFADSRKWLRKGWVDYLAPQLYWAIDNPGQRFPDLLRWWSRQNYENRFLWPGLYTSNLGNYPEYGWHSSEIINQILITREISDISGHIHFSMRAFMNNSGDISQRLIHSLYSEPALIPLPEWKSTLRPPKPKATLLSLQNEMRIRLYTPHKTKPWLWVIKAKYGNSWELYITSGQKEIIRIPKQTKKGKFIGVAVSRVNRLGSESAPVLLFPSDTIARLMQHPEVPKVLSKEFQNRFLAENLNKAVK